MSETAAREIVGVIRQFGSAKADPFEMLMVEGLRYRGVPDERARAAARECSNRIWRNGMVTGAVAVIAISATHANVPAAFAGGSAAALGGLYTFLFSAACRDLRELSGYEVLAAVDGFLAGR